MEDRLKFRAVLKTDKLAIIVPVQTIEQDGYIIDAYEANKVFEEKYPDESTWDFWDEIEKQDYIQEFSKDSDILITKNFKNIMQCTGRKDSEGKLIYGGDILKTKCNQILCVEWHEKLASFGLRTNKWVFTHFFGEAVDPEDTKIIGNIFENPELLEGRN